MADYQPSHPFFVAAVIAAERAARQGMPITAETLHSEDEQVPVSVAYDLLASPRFTRALEDVGVNLSPTQRVSSEQLAAVHLYLADASRSHAAKLRAAGISPSKWRGWMQQPYFRDYISQHAVDALHGALPQAHLALADKAGSGDMPAISMLYRLTGFYDPDAPADDPRKLFEAIFEILSDEGVPDATLAKIAGRVREQLSPSTNGPASSPRAQQTVMLAPAARPPEAEPATVVLPTEEAS